MAEDGRTSDMQGVLREEVGVLRFVCEETRFDVDEEGEELLSVCDSGLWVSEGVYEFSSVLEEFLKEWGSCFAVDTTTYELWAELQGVQKGEMVFECEALLWCVYELNGVYGEYGVSVCPLRATEQVLCISATEVGGGANIVTVVL